MSQEKKSHPATTKEPRTRIEDIPQPDKVLSEEEAALVTGGMIARRPGDGYSTCTTTGDDRD
jgi:hypothetical protein